MSNRAAFVLAFVGTLAVTVAAWAFTTDQIWQAVYDSAHTAIRINQVSP